MAWVACDENGSEWIYDGCPDRGIKNFVTNRYCTNAIELPSGSIKELIGRDLTWDDEPIELKNINN